ncbi:hypothetical protein GTR04_0639 [Trichophyton interdigitale]|uniref:Uncharacterized protein n=1 Tax=Trichophyton interdigitale TaxID=101480 RepID=A0A9P4YFM6_9EURO|nr:hypothetical protein GY632_3608 [Trichophyton interdigitale]KAF3897892.1 hypothetical protein GY631_1363 [Trichophyton interdigitale]KAG8212014.1 hypothetical protein GTR04_0639 [Trichophyton interdigitale]
MARFTARSVHAPAAGIASCNARRARQEARERRRLEEQLENEARGITGVGREAPAASSVCVPAPEPAHPESSVGRDILFRVSEPRFQVVLHAALPSAGTPTCSWGCFRATSIHLVHGADR